MGVTILKFDQIRLKHGKQPGPLAKILAAATGLILFGASLFLGVVFLFAAILFVVMVAIVARFRGPATNSGQGSDGSSRRTVLEGEYVVVDSGVQPNKSVGWK